MPCLVKRRKTLDKPLNSGCHIEDLLYLSILGETIGFCLTSDSLAERKVGVTDKGTKFVGHFLITTTPIAELLRIFAIPKVCS